MEVETGEDRKRATRFRKSATIWVMVCVALLLWWAIRYATFFMPLGEWQFGEIGRYYPTFTLLLLLLIVTVPIGLLIWGAARRRTRNEREALGDKPDLLAKFEADRTLLASERYRRFFGAITVAAGVLAVGFWLSLFWLPSGRGDPSSIRAQTLLVDGPATLEGGWRGGRIARFREQLGFIGRTIYVAPVHLRGEPGAPALVTTLEPVTGGRWTPVTAGILVRDGVPNELAKLYAEVGLPLAPDAAMLMRDEAQVRWRTVAVAGQLTVAAIILALVWGAFRRQARRIAEHFEAVRQGDDAVN